MSDAVEDARDRLVARLASYTIFDIIQLLRERVSIPRTAKRNRQQLVAFLRTLDPILANNIAADVDVRDGHKRRHPRARVLSTAEEPPVKKRRVVLLVNGARPSTAAPVAEELGFLEPVSVDTTRACIARFIDRTNNASLRKGVCVCCARKLFGDELRVITLEDIPNPGLLQPTHPHPAHQLTRGMLLHLSAAQQSRLFLCDQCHGNLRKAERPPLSLANNMWIGSIPFALDVLTLAERLLVSLYFPAAYVVKFYMKGRHKRSVSTNSGLRGNVSTYPLNTERIVDMIEGKILPRPPQLLAALIGVTFVGVTDQPVPVLSRLFKVRRARVWDALVWLRSNNPFYADLVLSEAHLQLLPDDAVPSEILDNVRHVVDPEDALKERSGYVPESDDDDEVEPTADNRQSLRSFDGIASPIGIPSDVRPIAERLSRGEGRPVVDAEGSVYASVPISANGVVDVEGQDIPDSVLFAHAARNLADDETLARFNVQKGTRFVSEYPQTRDKARFDGGIRSPNHLLGAFPCLFPYGTGGFEVDRVTNVTYEAHAKWALQYEDGRFRLDFHFIFQVFGVLQKRLICRFSALQLAYQTYTLNRAAFLSLRAEDFLLASVEETRKMPFSNPVMQALRRQLGTIRARVMGTDESRIAIRAQIWGMSLRFNPPTIWATINLSDTGDPIAQFLAGQEIDLDRFVAAAGPGSTARTTTVAADPYAAAEFFHVVIRVILEEMFGIRVGSRGATERKPGIVGTVNGYIGTVEAQGRGTLHLHILFWLSGAPTASQMRDALATPEFRQRIQRFIAQNIRADVASVTPAAFMADRTKRRNAAFCRPVDPREADYEALSAEAERRLARAVQVHECNTHNCLVSRGGRMVCKRSAPWPLSESDWVDQDGNWGPRRRITHLNNWNPPLLQVTRANHDMKLITNGWETKDITFYITLYIAKRQVQTANASALLAGSADYHRTVRASQPPEKDLNRMLLEQCANTLSRRQELSAPEVISYLMGWGDRYISHHYVRLRWVEFTHGLRQAYAGIARFDPPEHLDVPSTVLSSESTQGGGEPEMVGTLTRDNGRFVLKDQVSEYADRGVELEGMNVYDYFTRTYHGKPLPDVRNLQVDADTEDRISSQRVAYLPTSERAGCRVVRSPGSESNLHVIGPWFLRRDDPRPEYYQAQIMTLLKPWRDLRRLHEPFSSLADAWAAFRSSATPEINRIIDNIQYYHDCVASVGRPSRHVNELPLTDALDPEVISDDDADPSREMVITEEAIHAAMSTLFSGRTSRYGEHALLLAHSLGIFLDRYDCVPPTHPVARASPDEHRTFQEWGNDIAKRARAEGLLPVGLLTGSAGEAVMEDVRVAAAARHLPPAVHATIPALVTVGTPDVDPFAHARSLNDEQRLAHDLVHRHLQRTLAGVEQEQLLMIVQGEGGTGKTVLLKAISATFNAMGATALLAKTATTGVAASLFGGQTLHNWAAISVGRGRGKRSAESPSKPNKKRIRNIGPVQYLLIDEFSMLTKATLCLLSNIIGEIKASAGTAPAARPFGNINVILVGDPHQFPPVGNPRGALYAARSDGTIESELGRAIYLQFRTVVTLTQQRRVVDRVWTDLLRRLRTGSCTADDMHTVDSILVGHPTCELPSWQAAPWDQAVLVTPRHSCRTLWNSSAIRKHEALTGNPVYVSVAEDVCTTDWLPLDLEERLQVAKMTLAATAKLAHRVELAVGMKAMVLLNIATEADLSNGTRGQIVDMRLDPREPSPLTRDAGTGFIRLRYPPAVVFFKPDGAGTSSFRGLPPGVIPVVPSVKGFHLSSHLGEKTIKRHQLAMTPGYAFTDYKSQGQTIEHVLVDLQQPPNGGLTAFHAYVALSRSRGRDNIRILRGYDPKVFTTHPSEDLRVEDARLQELTAETRLGFAASLS